MTESKRESWEKKVNQEKGIVIMEQPDVPYSPEFIAIVSEALFCFYVQDQQDIQQIMENLKGRHAWYEQSLSFKDQDLTRTVVTMINNEVEQFVKAVITGRVQSTVTFMEHKSK